MFGLSELTTWIMTPIILDC